MSSISSCSTSAILLINQSSYLLAANQFSSQISYQHIVMTFFTYKTRLIIFELWSHKNAINLILIEYCHKFSIASDYIECSNCDLTVNWTLDILMSLMHMKRAFHCFFVKDFLKKRAKREIDVIKAKKAAVVAQKATEQEAVDVIKAVKSEICVKNLDFLDSIMQVNLWKNFRISVNSASFLHHMIEFVVNYQEKSVLKALKTSLRDSALTWFKDQLKFISLNDFKTIIAKIFSFSSIFEASLDQTIINSSSLSSQYHRCSQCFMKFSSTSRFLNHTQKNDCNKITCKLCEAVFTSNNKLHKHVRLHHNQKAVTFSKTMIMRSKFHMLDTSSAIFKLTSTIQTFSHQSIIMMKASVVCSPSFSSRSSTFSHQKFYMIMNDLFVMFVDKKKRSKKSLNIIHKRMRFSRFSMSDQTQIINYFKFADQSNSASIKSSIFDVFVSSFCSTFRFCFSVNQSAESQSSKASKSIKSFKDFKSAVFVSSICSTLRFYLSINDKSITSQTINHIIDLLQAFRVLLEQWIDVFVALINDISLSSSFSYEFMYSRRNDAERKKKIMWRLCIG